MATKPGGGKGGGKPPGKGGKGKAPGAGDNDAGGLADLFKKSDVADDLEKILKKFGAAVPEVKEAFDELAKTSKETRDSLQKAAIDNSVTTRGATAATKHMQKQIEELTEAFEKTTKGQVVTTKTLQKLLKPLKETTKAFKDDLKVIKAKTKNDKISFKETLRAAAVTARLKATNLAIEAKKTANEKATGKLREFAGTGGIGPSKLGGGAIGAVAELGPWGVAAAAVMAVITKAFDQQRDSVIQAQQWMLNYGDTTKDAHDNAIEMSKALVRASKQAAKYGADVEATMATVNKLAVETGTAPQKISDETIKGLIRLSKEGLGTIDDMGEDATEVANTTGEDVNTVVKDLESIARSARAAIDETGLAITMSDFYKSVKEIDHSVGSLKKDTRGLAKAFTYMVKLAGDSKLASERARKASEGLVAALAGEEEGFATLDIGSNLEAAIKAGNQDALEIKKKMDEGLYDPEMAARYFKQVGGTEIPEVMGNVAQNVINRSMDAQGKLSMRLVEAQLGPMTADQAKIVEKLAEQMRAGISPADAMKQLSEKDRAGYEKLVEDSMESTKDPMDVIKAHLKDILNTLANNLPNMLTKLTDLLAALDTGVKQIVDAINGTSQIIKDFRTNWKAELKDVLQWVLTAVLPGFFPEEGAEPMTVGQRVQAQLESPVARAVIPGMGAAGSIYDIFKKVAPADWITPTTAAAAAKPTADELAAAATNRRAMTGAPAPPTPLATILGRRANGDFVMRDPNNVLGVSMSLAQSVSPRGAGG